MTFGMWDDQSYLVHPRMCPITLLAKVLSALGGGIIYLPLPCQSCRHSRIWGRCRPLSQIRWARASLMQCKEGFVASEVAARSCLHEEEEIEGSDRQVLIRNWKYRKGSSRRVAL